jgi:hypothetical protein
MHRSRCVRKPCMCKAYNHSRERMCRIEEVGRMLTLLSMRDLAFSDPEKANL